MKNIVFCTDQTGFRISCNARTCAERRLLEYWENRAHVAGVQYHAVADWVRRKAGVFSVERHTKDGMATFCLPCLMCRRALDSRGLKWTALTREGVFVDEQSAPASKLTSRQRFELTGEHR